MPVMRKRICSFRPFHLKSNPGFVHDLQELVFYGGSRMAAAVSEMEKASQEAWKQKCLQKELFVIMSYIGIASTLGYVIEIPYIIRSLADSLLPVSPEDLPLEFDPCFARNLANNSVAQDEQIIESYHNPWWNWTCEPTPEQIMSNVTISSYIQHHRKFREPPEIYPIPPLLQLQISDDAHPSCDQCFVNEAIAHRSILRIKAFKESIMAAMQGYKDALLTSKYHIESLEEPCTSEDSLPVSFGASRKTMLQCCTNDIKSYQHVSSQHPEIGGPEQYSSNEDEGVGCSNNDKEDASRSYLYTAQQTSLSKNAPDVDDRQNHEDASARKSLDNLSINADTPLPRDGHWNENLLGSVTINETDIQLNLASTLSKLALNKDAFQYLQDNDRALNDKQHFAFQSGENLHECLQQIAGHLDEVPDDPMSVTFDIQRVTSASDGQDYLEVKLTDGCNLQKKFSHFLNASKHDE